eukprot:CAMPEP_0203670314 /NCGR_PEP_ID=MMETSP0090-20130426/6424_1 /ASSEMBLY_ACC=CAM_ASM_001088 /TAXON_ID=426623 /ORGANISM="Chaetoceros affinis, Strain CCMP159" /LENGTH=435 /DNA_ID=CAMNT_0050535143 /DNA_START=73 /DNA_END=1380 /DNA_ORIENTATION=+
MSSFRWSIFSMYTLIVVIITVNNVTRFNEQTFANLFIPSLPATAEEHAKVPTDPDLLLSVPFYVYEDEFLKDDSVWNITGMYDFYMTKLPKKNSTNGTNAFMELAETFKYEKHAGDIHFIRSALQHPMRVLNPEDAKLFVVPTLLQRIIVQFGYKPEAEKEQARKLILNANEVLRASPWFQRYDGADHIAPISLWKTDKSIAKYFDLLTRCNVVQFHETGIENAAGQNYIHPNYQQNRTMFKIFYVGSPCNVTSFAEKTQDFAFIGTMQRGRGRNYLLQTRRNACEWMTHSTNYSYSVCGTGDRCPNLSQALVGLHTKGDSPGANRLFDTLLSGTVPVFTNKLQYLTQSDFYDWDMLSYFANAENKTDFLDHMDKILSNRTDIEVKTKNVLENRDLFDWQTLVPFDIYMYHLQAKLYPEIPLVNSSKYSALILPK